MHKLNIKQADFERAFTVKVLIEKEYHKHYSYKDFPRIVGSNEQTIKVAFKELTGKSPYEYLTEIRMQKAKDLLESTDLTIEVIARRVGLHRTNLTKQFLKLYGMAPAAWRNQSRN